jgi:hypothetical protein
MSDYIELTVDIPSLEAEVSINADDLFEVDAFREAIAREAKDMQETLERTPVHEGDDRRSALCSDGMKIYDLVAKIVELHIDGNEKLACKCATVTDPKEVPVGISNRLQAIEKFMRRQSNDMYDTFTRLQSPAQQAELHDEEPF